MDSREADAVYSLAGFDDEGLGMTPEIKEELSSDDVGVVAAVREAIEVMEDALDTYGEHLSLSFNGGKDCTVLLHIYAAVLHRRRHGPSSEASTSSPTSSTTLSSVDSSASPEPISTIYIPMPSPFPEMESFIDESAKSYGLDIFRVPCAEGSSGKKGMKEALEMYGQFKPGVKAILIGIRRGDPFSETLTHRDMTDKDWPAFMRIHPIINWSYAQIWRFLRVLKVNYCSLYDQGYTSLGSTYNTYPNPALKVEGPPSENHHGAMFKPAYELVDDSLERCGRVTVPLVQTKENNAIGCHRMASPVTPSRKVESLQT